MSPARSRWWSAALLSGWWVLSACNESIPHGATPGTPGEASLETARSGALDPETGVDLSLQLAPGVRVPGGRAGFEVSRVALVPVGGLPLSLPFTPVEVEVSGTSAPVGRPSAPPGRYHRVELVLTERTPGKGEANGRGTPRTYGVDANLEVVAGDHFHLGLSVDPASRTLQVTDSSIVMGVYVTGSGRDYVAIQVAPDGTAQMKAGREPRLVASGSYFYNPRSRLLSFYWSTMTCPSCRGAQVMPASMFRDLPDLSNLYVTQWSERSIKGFWQPLGWAAHPVPPPGQSGEDGGVADGSRGGAQSAGEGDPCHQDDEHGQSDEVHGKAGDAGQGLALGQLRFCFARAEAFTLDPAYPTTEADIKAVYPSAAYNGRLGVAVLIPMPGEPGVQRVDVQKIDKRNAVFRFQIDDADLRQAAPVHYVVRFLVVDQLEDLQIVPPDRVIAKGEQSMTQFPVDVVPSPTPVVAVVDFQPYVQP